MARTLRQRMRDLKLALQVEEDFSGITQKFLDMTEMEEFNYLGKTRDNEILESMLTKVLEKVYGEPKTFALRMKYLKKFGFYHGSIIVDSLPGTVMYFEGIQMGMVAISTDLSGNVSYVRFTGEIVMDGSFTGTKHSPEVH